MLNATALAAKIHRDSIVNHFYDEIDKLDSIGVYTHTFCVGDDPTISDMVFKAIASNRDFSTIEELVQEDEETGDQMFFIHVDFTPSKASILANKIKGE